MDIGQNIIFPEPRNQHEKDLFSVMGSGFNDIIRILDKGILFTDNVDCQLVSFTSNAVADTEDTVAHGLGKIPTGYFVYSRDKAGVLYDGGTSWTSSNIYVKCNVASVAFKIIVF